MGLPFSIMSSQVAGVIHIVLFSFSSEVTDLKQNIELGLWAPVSQRLDINHVGLIGMTREALRMGWTMGSVRNS